jgi:hypothetical protein
MDVGAVEQRANRRNQHDIVGPNQFPQSGVLLFRLLCRPFAAPVNRIVRLPALAAPARAFYCT